MNQFEQIQLGTGVIAVTIPLLVWYLERKDKRDDLYKLDRHIKRLESLQKLSAVGALLTDTQKRQQQDLIGNEIKSVLEYFSPKDKEIKAKRDLIAFHALSGFRRAFLLFRPANAIVFALQIFFYYFIAVSLLVVGFVIQEMLDYVKYGLSGDNLIAFFLVITVCIFPLRRLAIKYQEKSLVRLSRND